MKRIWLLFGACGCLFITAGLSVADEPRMAARLPGPTFLASFCPQYSLTEPPQVEGLLAGSACAGAARCPSAPQMIGSASLGVYRFGGNENVLPATRVFGNFTSLPTANALPRGK